MCLVLILSHVGMARRLWCERDSRTVTHASNNRGRRTETIKPSWSRPRRYHYVEPPSSNNRHAVIETHGKAIKCVLKHFRFKVYLCFQQKWRDIISNSLCDDAVILNAKFITWHRRSQGGCSGCTCTPQGGENPKFFSGLIYRENV